MTYKKAPGFTLIELLVVVAVIAVLIAILLPSLGSAREAMRKAKCGTNLTGIGKAMNIYAAQENVFPTNLPPKTAAKVGKWSNPPSALQADDGVDPIAKLFNPVTSTVQGDPLINLWLLVLEGYVPKPAQFTCPSDPNSPTPAQVRYDVPIWSSSGIFLNFGTVDDVQAGGPTFSYAFAYPWSSTAAAVPAWWKGNPDATRAIGADIGPSKTPPLDDPTAPPGTSVSNSKNHARKGQNVLFADAHVAFESRNDVGHNNDNIYTGDGGNIYVMTGGTKFNVLTNLNANPDDSVLVPASSGNP